MGVVRIYSWLCMMIDRGVSWVSENMPERAVERGSGALHDLNSGVINQYLLWTLSGLAFLVLLFLVLV